MSFKSILVHLGDGHHDADRGRIAVDLAVRFQAHLVGVYTPPPPPIFPAMPLPGNGMALLASDYERLRKDRVDAARTLFEALAAGCESSSFEVTKAYDNTVQALADHALVSDLLVLGQSEPGEAAADGLPAALPDLLADASGAPVLVIPYAGSFKAVGQNVLVAWKPSPQAARSVRAALPLLRQAKNVTVVSFVDAGSRRQSDAPSVTQVATMLARHGVKAKAVEQPHAGSGIGELLLSYSADLQSDLFVMGCYSHIRLRERVFGGITRTMLESMTLPVLMAR